MPLTPLFQKQLSLPGFNASIIPTADGYEMCMSLHTEGSELVACVSVDDEASYIQKYNLQDILDKLIK